VHEHDTTAGAVRRQNGRNAADATGRRLDAESSGVGRDVHSAHAVAFWRRCAFGFGHVSLDSTETTPGIRSV
jgi:hypothetical protein